MGETTDWRTLCVQAEKALAAGQRGEARRLARRAAKLAPDKVEPWLLLASLASSPASQAYIKTAVANNPSILRAVSAMRWARRGSAGRHAGQRASALPKAAGPGFPKLAVMALWILPAITALFIIFAWLRPPGVDEGLRAIGAAAAQQLDELFAPATAPPSATFTATFTPFATRTQLPTATPTSTPALESSQGAGSTPLGLELDIDKFDLDPPQDISPDERWIDVNLSEQTLSAFEGANLLNTFDVSSGRAGSPTVTGEFRVWVKVRIQAMSGPGYYIENVPWVMYFYRSYGIHGTWWHDNFGTPMSAGCVNMRIPDAEWMYQWASVGTVVMVHY